MWLTLCSNKLQFLLTTHVTFTGTPASVQTHVFLKVQSKIILLTTNITLQTILARVSYLMSLFIPSMWGFFITYLTLIRYLASMCYHMAFLTPSVRTHFITYLTFIRIFAWVFNHVVLSYFGFCLINEWNSSSHAYRSLKQTAGWISCPWTTILVRCRAIYKLMFRIVIISSSCFLHKSILSVG